MPSPDRRAWLGCVALKCCLLLAACASPPAQDPAVLDETALTHADTTLEHEGFPPVPDRPAVLDDALEIEGMREPMTFTLYRSPEGFPLPFSTYLPADIEPEPALPGEEQLIRFVPHFGGARTEGAWLAVHVPSGDPSAAEMQDRVRQVAESLGRAERVEGEGYAWALEEYRVQGRDAVGGVVLGRHAGRYFFLVRRYPPEMGDGLAPRIGRLLAEWRWADGARLGA